MRKEIYKKKTNRCSTKKTNWQVYSSILGMEENRLEEGEFIELQMKERYKYIVNKMKEAVTIATYRKRQGKSREEKEVIQNKESVNKVEKKRNNPVSWWDKECQDAIERRKEKLQEFKRSKKVENYIKYKRLGR